MYMRTFVTAIAMLISIQILETDLAAQVLPSGRATAVLVNPQNPNVVYVGTDGWIYKSSDTGATWARLPVAVAGGGTLVNALALDPQHSDIVFAATNDGVFETTDGGQNWIHPFGAPYCAEAITTRSGASLTIFADSCGYGIYRSGDGGVTW